MYRLHCTFYASVNARLPNTFQFHISNNSAYFIKCVSKMTYVCPPAKVRGLKILKREEFSKSLQVPVIQIEDSLVSSVMKFIKKYLLKLENFKPVQFANEVASVSSDNESTNLLRPDDITKEIFLDPIKIKHWSDIDASDREQLIQFGISEESFQEKNITISYENWRSDEIFKAVFPPNTDNLTSYSKIGHIVHVNLKDHLMDYKSLIGQVLLDKVKGCKTVINKTNTIDNTYRNFAMEVLCGESNFQALVKENKCSFEFDFSQVYWNPRLCTEHERIVGMLKSGDILFDVFAGVGPFSIPALKKKCTVFANDLNPESYKWLLHNAKLNKVLGPKFTAYNLDGRQFIKETFSAYLVQNLTSSGNSLPNIHMTMNLPAIAVEFLNAFKGVLSHHIEKNSDNFKEPIVHVYCFAIGDDPIETAKSMVEKNLGCALNDRLIDVFYVRNVSPKKEMMRVSFHLSAEVLFGIGNNLIDDNYEPHNKIKKL